MGRALGLGESPWWQLLLQLPAPGVRRWRGCCVQRPARPRCRHAFAAPRSRSLAPPKQRELFLVVLYVVLFLVVLYYSRAARCDL